jgi:hypothetical protein
MEKHDQEFDDVVDNLKKQREEYKRLRHVREFGIDIEALLVEELNKNINQSIIDELMRMSKEDEDKDKPAKQSYCGYQGSKARRRRTY